MTFFANQSTSDYGPEVRYKRYRVPDVSDDRTYPLADSLGNVSDFSREKHAAFVNSLICPWLKYSYPLLLTGFPAYLSVHGFQSFIQDSSPHYTRQQLKTCSSRHDQ
ncbi:hypothetical protein AX17_004198 [Amanita inopinata Kibby_2008]|nr:hypothetical protein AX17_004198 [Amanita inopinata Kibby_2008]